MSVRINPAIVSPMEFKNQNNINFGSNSAKVAGQNPNFLTLTNPDYNVMQISRGMNYRAARAVQESAVQINNPNFTGITNTNNPVHVNNAGRAGMAGTKLNLIC